ncbi:hypothetical protein [Arsenicicoccus bolidensis]|uniref:hypothetical protein n=1 Tax=Arsenicicoccus bolidensis TaxID=229480 RepID=UPI0028A6C8E4|nr:hypothetical protein [Arsenicicoccus bolidensis]
MVDDLDGLVRRAGPLVWRWAQAIVPRPAAREVTEDVLVTLAGRRGEASHGQVRAVAERRIRLAAREQDVPQPDHDDLDALWGRAASLAGDGVCPVSADDVRARMTTAHRRRQVTALALAGALVVAGGWVAVDRLRDGTPSPTTTQSPTASPTSSGGAASPTAYPPSSTTPSWTPTQSGSAQPTPVPEPDVLPLEAYEAALGTAAGRRTSALPRVEQQGADLWLVRGSGTTRLARSSGRPDLAMVTPVAFGPDGGAVVVLADQGGQGEMGTELRWWKGQGAPVRAAGGEISGFAVSPDGSRLAYVEWATDGGPAPFTVRVIDAATGTEVARQEVPTSAWVASWTTRGVLIMQTVMPETPTPTGTAGPSGDPTPAEGRQGTLHFLWELGQRMRHLDLPDDAVVAPDSQGDPAYVMRLDDGRACTYRVPVSDITSTSHPCLPTEAMAPTATSPDGRYQARTAGPVQVMDLRSGRGRAYGGSNPAMRSPATMISGWEDGRTVLLAVSPGDGRAPVMLRWDVETDAVERVPGPPTVVVPALRTFPR